MIGDDDASLFLCQMFASSQFPSQAEKRTHVMADRGCEPENVNLLKKKKEKKKAAGNF